MRKPIARMIKRENVQAIPEMNAKFVMIRTIRLLPVKGVTKEIAVIGNDLTG